jgi:hypothetical protein
MILATEQPTKWQHLMRESDIVTDRAADKTVASHERKQQSGILSLVKATKRPVDQLKQWLHLWGESDQTIDRETDNSTDLAASSLETRKRHNNRRSGFSSLTTK